MNWHSECQVLCELILTREVSLNGHMGIQASSEAITE